MKLTTTYKKIDLESIPFEEYTRYIDRHISIIKEDPDLDLVKEGIKSLGYKSLERNTSLLDKIKKHGEFHPYFHRMIDKSVRSVYHEERH